MNNFLALLDKLAQKAPLADAASVRVFKLEANPDQPKNIPSPQRLEANSPYGVSPGQSAFGRQRRPHP